MLTRSKEVPIGQRFGALQTLVEVAEGRLSEEVVQPARRVLEHAGERLALGPGSTVVALAGATGSGKSSLFNELAGSAISAVGVRRPTTSVTSAAVWGDVDADELLDWLQIERRHRVDGQENNGLVLLDLPDHDSTQASHRAEVDRLVERVDVFVWVVDPQKYADALLHEGYLRPLATHAPVTIVVLNQIDRLAPEDRRRCIQDLTRLLAEDGLDRVNILATSATNGAGLPELRALIASRVAATTAAVERIRADVRAVAERFSPYCGPHAPREVGSRDRARLVEAMAGAAGADLVAEAVGRSHRRRAALAVGWPFTRWLRRLRPDPLGRLHLGPESGGGRTSLRVARTHRAEIENATRAATAVAAEDLPEPWPDVMRARVLRPTDEVSVDLDRAVGNADLGDLRGPRWWRVVGALQKVVALIAVAGFVWLTLLFVLEWFQVPRPPTPEFRSFPWPTVLLIGGVIAGLLIGWVSGWFARAGALRRARRASSAIAREVEEVADEHVLRPLEDEQRAYLQICGALHDLLERDL